MNGISRHAHLDKTRFSSTMCPCPQDWAIETDGTFSGNRVPHAGNIQSFQSDDARSEAEPDDPPHHAMKNSRFLAPMSGVFNARRPTVFVSTQCPLWVRSGHCACVRFAPVAVIAGIGAQTVKM
jgi:hypothetical protein